MNTFYPFTQRLGLVLGLLLCTASWATAQTTRTVCATGCGFTTIQAAVNASSNGDTVLVLDGTYTENVTVDSKSITIRSLNGRGSTTLQGISGAGALGALVVQGTTTSGFKLDGFTVVGIDNGAPGVENAAVYVRGSHTNLNLSNNEVQANGDGGFLAEFGATLTNPVINNNWFTGQTFVGPNPAGEGFSQQFTLPNVPRQLVTLGNGGGLSGANVTGLVFTNNEVTGTAGGLNPSGDEQGNTLATLDAANATITGNLFAGTTTRFGAQLRIRRPGASITGNTFESDGLGDLTNHLFIQNNGTPLPTIAANNTFDRGAYAELGSSITVTVAPAVGGAVSGDTVHIFPATYTEQVFVVGKELTIDGVDPDSTTIVAPNTADLVTCYTTSGPNLPVVCAIDGADMTLQNLTVDGNGQGNGIRLLGVGIHQSDATVRNTVVTRVRATPFSGAQNGLAILATSGDDGNPYSIVLEDNTISDFQKGGIVIDGTGITATVDGNTVIGAGPVDETAQNGIQISRGTGGTVSNNIVSGFSFDPIDNSRDFFDASGILLFNAANTVVDGNMISACEGCLLAADTPATIQNNTITSSSTTSGDDDYSGIYAYSFVGPVGARAATGSKAAADRGPVAQPVLEGDLVQVGRAGTVAYDVLGNTITGGDGDSPADTSSIGLIGYAFEDGTSSMLDFRAEENDINGFTVGVYICENTPGAVLPVDLDGFNDLSNNDTALYTCIESDTDAENNDWGVYTKPAIEALIQNDGTGVVDFVPFVGSPVHVDLTTSPTSSLTVAPGGSIDFNYTITNYQPTLVSGDFYYVAQLNGNTVASGIIVSGSIPPGGTLSASFTQNVPNNAPENDYTYRLRIGSFPNAVVDEEVYIVTVDNDALARGTATAWSTEAEPWAPVEGATTEALDAAASEALPTEFGVTSAPNPATHRATLHLAMPEAGQAKVTVYDVRGREVAVAVDRELGAGTHAVGLDVSGLASGVYIVRAQSASHIAVQRITVVR